MPVSGVVTVPGADEEGSEPVGVLILPELTDGLVPVGVLGVVPGSCIDGSEPSIRPVSLSLQPANSPRQSTQAMENSKNLFMAFISFQEYNRTDRTAGKAPPA